MRSSTRASRPRAAAGFSLAELVVSLAGFIAVLLAVLFIFNLNFRLARSRSDAAQGLEALRGAQHDLERLVDMAGRGGLPRHLAIGVETNAEPGRRIGGPGSPPVLAGTDILTVRGVFSAPLYRVGSAGGRPGLAADGTPFAGFLEIRDPSPQTGVAQDLTELAVAVAARPPAVEALLLTSQLDPAVYAVILSDLGAAVVRREGDRIAAITLRFDAARTPRELAGAGATAALRGAALVGILEEYRFYIRAAHATPGDAGSRPRPQLSMARFLPGTDLPWAGNEASLAVDLADNVVDLQAALGFDVDGDGSVSDDPDDPSGDEWLYDDPDDDDAEPRWRAAETTLARLRITTVTPFGDTTPSAASARRLEDRLGEAATAATGGERRRLESVVEFENG